MSSKETKHTLLGFVIHDDEDAFRSLPSTLVNSKRNFIGRNLKSASQLHVTTPTNPLYYLIRAEITEISNHVTDEIIYIFVAIRISGEVF